MKVFVFYFSWKRGPGRRRIQLDSKTWGYIRVDAMEVETKKPGGDELMLALDKATPQPDEYVMNSHSLPPSV